MGRHPLGIQQYPSFSPVTVPRFQRMEQFSVILALVLYWIGSIAYETTQRGLALMNDAIKEKVESRARCIETALKQKRVESSNSADSLSDASTGRTIRGKRIFLDVLLNYKTNRRRDATKLCPHRPDFDSMV